MLVKYQTDSQGYSVQSCWIRHLSATYPETPIKEKPKQNIIHDGSHEDLNQRFIIHTSNIFLATRLGREHIMMAMMVTSLLSSPNLKITNFCVVLEYLTFSDLALISYTTLHNCTTHHGEIFMSAHLLMA